MTPEHEALLARVEKRVNPNWFYGLLSGSDLMALLTAARREQEAGR
jgi:hypothetical protein